MTLDDILREGRAAADLLANQIFLTAVERVTDEIVTRWHRADDPDERETCWHEQKALARVIRQLQRQVEDSELAKKQLNEDTADPRLGDPQGAEHPQGELDG